MVSYFMARLDAIDLYSRVKVETPVVVFPPRRGLRLVSSSDAAGAQISRMAATAPMW
jgi:hypothetical protein